MLLMSLEQAKALNRLLKIERRKQWRASWFTYWGWWEERWFNFKLRLIGFWYHKVLRHKPVLYLKGRDY